MFYLTACCVKASRSHAYAVVGWVNGEWAVMNMRHPKTYNTTESKVIVTDLFSCRTTKNSSLLSIWIHLTGLPALIGEATVWYSSVHRVWRMTFGSCGESGTENDGGEGAREFVADSSDRGAWLLRLVCATGCNCTTCLGPLSEWVSEMERLSLGFFPFRMSFSLSGSSSKST